jgi:hypothetical protein
MRVPKEVVDYIREAPDHAAHLHACGALAKILEFRVPSREPIRLR